MSKLAEHINATITNHRIVSPNINMIKEVYSPASLSSSIPYAYKVKFQAIFGKEIYIDESEAMQNSSVMQYHLESIKKGVIEEVFGEFRTPIMDIRYSLFDKDTNKALEQLEKLEKQMFNV